MNAGLFVALLALAALLFLGAAALLAGRNPGRSLSRALRRKRSDAPARAPGARESSASPESPGPGADLNELRFAVNAARIAPESGPALDRLAQELQRLFEARPGLRIRVEGHTDHLGTPESNLSLSRRRAESVCAALAQRGVAPERLEAIGYGASRPVAPPDSQGRPRNRRVALQILDGP